MSHQEIQIAPGVYITDFRKNGELKGIQQPKSQLTNDVGLLLDDCNTLESKSKQLQYTIEEIKNQDNWEEDGDFRDAVQEDWNVLIRFSEEMKQKILKLASLNYQPETTKIEELLNLQRVEKRQQRARQQLSQIIKSREKKLQQVEQEPITQKQQQKHTEQKQQEDKGIYL